MIVYSVLLGLVLLGAVLFLSTANMAIRHFSRVELSERLAKKGREDRMSRLSDLRNEIAFSLALARMGCILALVLLVAYWLKTEFAFAADVQANHLMTEFLLVFLVSITLIMIFAVAIPHAWARHAGEAFLAAMLQPLFVLRRLLYPLLALQHGTDTLVRRLAGVPHDEENKNGMDQIEKEILDVVSEGELAGTVHEEDADMIESIIEFRDTDACEIMTPRTEMVALKDTATLAEAKELIINEGHSRIPVFGENIDEIKGVLYAKDLLAIDRNEDFILAEMMRKVPFVPETKKIPDLLKEFKERKVHLAIVLDEYGGTAGLVTIEDIVEEIVGEIADEYERPEPEPIQKIDDKTLEVDGRVHIDDLNDELDIELPEDEDYDTVGGFIFSKMGKIPESGEEFVFDNIRFEILEAEERRINRVRVEVRSDETAAKIPGSPQREDG